jgi:hypothetical protein
MGINWWMTPNVIMRIDWEHLIYDRDQNQIRSDSAFVYESPTEVLTGNSFVSDPGFKNVIVRPQPVGDLTWAEAEQSLGDFLWSRRDAQDWSGAWPHYQLALDYWAGRSELDVARARYLHIVWAMAEPSWMEKYYYNYGSYVPMEVLDNALTIATTDNDKAHAHYLIALTLRNQSGDWARRLRIPREFEGAIAAEKQADWYDDALYAYGEWLMSNGPARLLENGQWIQEPDYVRALEHFQRLLREFTKGETRFYDPAKQQIENITKPIVGVYVSNFFLPKSEVQYSLSWRNIKQVQLNLYRVDLTRDPRFTDRQGNINNWINDLDLAAAEKVKSWTKDTEDKGDYKPGQQNQSPGQNKPGQQTQNPGQTNPGQQGGNASPQNQK